MRKTSIFSKDYEKIVKRKKKVKGILSVVLLIVIVLFGVISLNYDSFKKFIVGNHDKTVQEDKNDTNINGDSKNKNQDDTNKDPNKKDKDIPKPSTDIYVDTTLPNGTKFRYRTDKDSTRITTTSSTDDYYMERAGSDKSFLLFYKKTYELFLVNVDGTSKNLTYETFITKEGTRIPRKDKIASDPSFIWMNNPMFYKDKIFYSTKLPNLNNTNRSFLWVCDIETGVHKGIYDPALRGNEISISGNANEKGMEIKFDNIIKYFDVDQISGEVIISD